MNALLRRGRLGALALLRSTGTTSLIRRSRWRQDRLMVLCYHGVSTQDEHEWASLYVSKAHLRKRLRRLRSLGCTILPLAEALERQAHRDLPPMSVAITFDDGAADFATHAYPVLQEESVQAMLYQTTWYVDKPFPVFNTMSSYLLWHARGETRSLPWGAEAATRIPTVHEASAFQRLHESLMLHVANADLDGEAQTQLLWEIAECCGVPLQPLLDTRILAMMSGDQLRALDPALIDIQMHTHRHRTPRDRNGFFAELDDNASALTSILKRDLKLRHFCYPSGVYRTEYPSWLQEWGMRSATTCDPALVSGETDRLRLPRLVDGMHLSDDMFDGWVIGALDWLPRRRASAPVEESYA